LNAALAVRDQEPAHFSRTNSYIGVMIDDLVTRGVSEPYRMFTSRAEFRLSLRADNADQRLTPFGIALGCVGSGRQEMFERKVEALEAGRLLMEAISLSPTEAQAKGFRVTQDGTRRSALQLLSFPDISMDQLQDALPSLADIPPEICDQLAKDALYANYTARQERDAASIKRDESWAIPEDFDYDGLTGLSNELKLKLEAARPQTLGQAGRVDGVTPAALTLLLAKLRQTKKDKIA
jgi:tRNA uridine 5-carboxymethylaminomethyl modification enzyme